MQPLYLTGLESASGWASYAQLPPNYTDETANPYQGFTRTIKQDMPSPLYDGTCTEFGISGSVVGDALFTLPIIGTESSQGLPDTGRVIVPAIHVAEYSGKFYIDEADLPNVGAVELDIGIYMGEISLTFGTQIRIANGNGTAPLNEWDIWDNVNKKWVPTGIRTYPLAGMWNKFRILVTRDSSNGMLYHTLQLNKVSTELKVATTSVSIPSQSSWWGVNINFQVDGTGKAVTVLAKNLSLYLE